jgi:putative hydrolases of HD superfamily
MNDRLASQLRFLVEVDRLKGVLRRTRLVDGSRRENSAEHSWHMALCAAVLAEHAPPGIDLGRALLMVMVHDVIEVDAGDTFCYDAPANVGKEERERLAADRIFGLLPSDQAAQLRSLWDEFEAFETAEARFAVAMDRLQPLLLNFHGGGGSWAEHGVSREQVLARMAPIREAVPSLWDSVLALIAQSVAAGWIQDEGRGPRTPPPEPRS